jgi:predicted RNase H-like nuclease (RuvC/YqgF family)
VLQAARLSQALRYKTKEAEQLAESLKTNDQVIQKLQKEFSLLQIQVEGKDGEIRKLMVQKQLLERDVQEHEWDNKKLRDDLIRSKKHETTETSRNTIKDLRLECRQLTTQLGHLQAVAEAKMVMAFARIPIAHVALVKLK